MRNVKILSLLMFFPLTIYAQVPSHEELVSLVQNRLPNDIIRNAEVFESNEIQISTYEASEMNINLETLDKSYRVARISGIKTPEFVIELDRASSNSSGVAAFHPSSGAPMLSVSDTNGDGSFDYISYTAVDVDGKSISEVIDYEMDGQADIRLHFNSNKPEIWHKNAWYEIETNENIRGINLEGEFKELEAIGNRLYVK